MYGYEKDVQAIEAWMKKNQVSSTALGIAVFNCPSTVRRLVGGKSTLKTLRRAMKHIGRYPKVKNPSRGK